MQWALAYLAGAWLLLQVLDLLGDNFDWPHLIVRSETIAADTAQRHFAAGMRAEILSQLAPNLANAFYHVGVPLL